MWSKPLLCRFQRLGEIPQMQVSQGFAAFHLAPPRIRPRHTQIKRDTNFATPGYSLFCHDTTAREKIKDFSVCGHLCGQSRFYATFSNRVKSSKRRCYKALRRFALPCSGYRHGTPKCGTVSTPPYPDRGGGYAAQSRTAYPYYIRFSPVLQGGNQPFRAAFRAATRSVASQRTPRSSRPMWP